MKINTLSSTHKKYIKKYGAKKAAEKYNLNLTKAKSYEKKYKNESFQGKRSINKSKSSKNTNSESIDVFEENSEAEGISNIGSFLGYDPSVHTSSGPQNPNSINQQPVTSMGQMFGSMGGMQSAAMSPMAPMSGMSMPGMPMPGMPMPGMDGMQSAVMSPTQAHMGQGAMSPVMDNSLTFDPTSGMSMGGMPMGGMPMGGMPMGGMPMGGMPMGGMPMGGMPMGGMFQGKDIDMSNVDPLMVEVAAPVNKYNGNMQAVQSLPNHLPNISLVGGGKIKVDLSRLSYF
jgi:hypothetical protein